MQTILKTLVFLVATTTITAQAVEPLPKGLMLNLDFQQVADGLVPSKTLYPLHVPLGGLEIMTNNEQRVFMMVEAGDALDIPHSSLLDPDGSDWVASIRIFALGNGMVMSQGDDEKGYAIYIKDGAVHAAVRTAHSTIILEERPENGITECLNAWITIELKFTRDMAILVLNRAHVAIAPLEAPLSGKDCRIRIGEHKTLPAPLLRDATATPAGFTGAIGSLKLLRQ